MVAMVARGHCVGKSCAPIQLGLGQLRLLSCAPLARSNGPSDEIRTPVDLISPQPSSLDLVFHALSDPARRLMVERLTRGSASVSELAQPLDMTLSAVVQHLAVLESSGLVRSEKVGRVRTCRMEPVGLRTAESWITERRSIWEIRFHRIAELLTDESNDARDQTST
jgi:DNA-binding transcriptional ArsR family regulator